MQENLVKKMQIFRQVKLEVQVFIGSQNVRRTRFSTSLLCNCCCRSSLVLQTYTTKQNQSYIGLDFFLVYSAVFLRQCIFSAIWKHNKAREKLKIVLKIFLPTVEANLAMSNNHSFTILHYRHYRLKLLYKCKLISHPSE